MTFEREKPLFGYAYSKETEPKSSPEKRQTFTEKLFDKYLISCGLEPSFFAKGYCAHTR